MHSSSRRSPCRHQAQTMPSERQRMSLDSSFYTVRFQCCTINCRCYDLHPLCRIAILDLVIKGFASLCADVKCKQISFFTDDIYQNNTPKCQLNVFQISLDSTRLSLSFSFVGLLTLGISQKQRSSSISESHKQVT